MGPKPCNLLYFPVQCWEILEEKPLYVTDASDSLKVVVEVLLHGQDFLVKVKNWTGRGGSRKAKGSPLFHYDEKLSFFSGDYERGCSAGFLGFLLLKEREDFAIFQEYPAIWT